MSVFPEDGLEANEMMSLLGLILLGTTKEFREGPIERINKYHGFRSRKSMKNETNWYRAQKLLGQYGRSYGLIMIFGGLVFLLGVYPRTFMGHGEMWQVLLMEGLIICVLLFSLWANINGKLD